MFGARNALLQSTVHSPPAGGSSLKCLCIEVWEQPGITQLSSAQGLFSHRKGINTDCGAALQETHVKVFVRRVITTPLLFKLFKASVVSLWTTRASTVLSCWHILWGNGWAGEVQNFFITFYQRLRVHQTPAVQLGSGQRGGLSCKITFLHTRQQADNLAVLFVARSADLDRRR